MAALSGTAGSVVYMTGGTTNIVGVREWSLDFGNNVQETTAFGDEWREVIAGIKQFSGSFSLRSDTDASNATLRNAALGGSAVALRLYDSTTTYYNVTSAILGGMSPSISYDGVGESSFDFEGSGALTYV